MNEIAAERSRDSPITSIKQNYLNLFYLFFDRPLGYDQSAWNWIRAEDEREETESYFAKRLITGVAAEQYFVSVQPSLPEFNGFVLENTTQLGCGYDFRLGTGEREDFLAVEVKGLRERTGSLSMTPKEHAVAMALRDRFFLFVVKNFHESPFHEIYQDPLSGALQFRKSERVIIQVSWVANV